MMSVYHHLRIGYVVDRCNTAVSDSDIFVDHFNHRSETVSGAGGSGNDIMDGRII